MEQDFDAYVRLDLTSSYLADWFDLLASGKGTKETGKEINSELKDLKKLLFTENLSLKDFARNLTVDLVKENLSDFGEASLGKIEEKLKGQVKGNPKDLGPKFLVQKLSYLKNAKGEKNLRELSKFFASFRTFAYKESARYDENFEIREGVAPLDVDGYCKALSKYMPKYWF